jgi:hypothetical protein
MITAGLTKGNCDLRLCEVALSLGKGEVGFAKHERRTL